MNTNDQEYARARELVLKCQNPSIGFLQRHLKLGYSHALKLMQRMEGDIVTSPYPSGWRRMLHNGALSPDELMFDDTSEIDSPASPDSTMPP